MCVCLCDLMNRVCTSIGLCVCACWGVIGVCRRLSEGNVCVTASCQQRLAKRDGRGREIVHSSQSLLQQQTFFWGQLMRYVNKSGCLVAKLAIRNPVYHQRNIYLLVRYLGGSCSRRWCLPSEHRCLRSGMGRGCMACRGSRSVGLCTLEGIDSDMSPPHSHICHH